MRALSIRQPYAELRRAGGQEDRVRREPPPHHQVVQERLDIRRPQLDRVLPAAVRRGREPQKVAGPVRVSDDGIVRQPPASGDDDELVESFMTQTCTEHIPGSSSMNLEIDRRRPPADVLQGGSV
jgi:hypothetical protein